MYCTPQKKTLVAMMGGMLSVAITPAAASAQSVLSTQEVQVTNNGAYNTTPVGASDSISSWVVYAQTTLGGSSGSAVWYQRFDVNGVLGAPVQVSTGSTSDQLDDADGNHIVYTAYASTSSLAGSIVLFNPATAAYSTVATANSVYASRVCGDVVVWLQGTAGATSLMMQSIAAPTASPQLIAGPTPAVSSADVGERFVVWEAVVNGQRDVMAYDLQQGVVVAVATDPNVNERLPHTSGAWVVWEVQGGSGTAIMAMNMDSQQRVTVAQNTFSNTSPTIDGNTVSYQSNPNGVVAVFVYRLDHADTFQVTQSPNDVQLNDVFGNMVTYVDNRSGQYNVYVSTLLFAAATPITPAPPTGGGSGPILGDPNSIVLSPNTVTSDPNAVAANPNAVTSDPNTVTINPNNLSADPNTASNPNAANPNAADPNTGYQGGCHHWSCDARQVVQLNLLRRHGSNHDDVGFCRAYTFQVPWTLPANDPMHWGKRIAYLMWQEVHGHSVICTYEHGSDQRAGTPYTFVGCSNGARAGSNVSINYLDLHWMMERNDRDEASAMRFDLGQHNAPASSSRPRW